MKTNISFLSSPEKPLAEDYSYFATTPSHTGILFYLPSRARFIPYAWLLHAEVNRDETELTLYYTQCVVTIQGKQLVEVLKALQDYHLNYVQEMPLEATKERRSYISRIDIVEKE